MRKTCILTALALLIGATGAGAASVSVGAFGGVSIPVLNDLSTQGTVFGARVPVNVLPLLTVEPFFAKSALGEAEESFGGSVTYTRDGGDLTAFGVNALLTMGGGGLRFYPAVGLGSYKLERDGAEEISEVGFNFGLGLGFSPPSVAGLGIDLRGEFVMVPTEDTSQKFANVTLGVTYKIFSTPTP